MITKEVAVDDVDDDAVHIAEHVRYVLCEYDDLTEAARARIYAHIRLHKNRVSEAS